MKRALQAADAASRALAATPILLVTWWASTLPLLLSTLSLVQRALEHGLPTQAGDLVILLLWSCVVVVAWAWYVLGSIFLHQQARAGLRRRPVPMLPTPRRLLDLFPATAMAHASRAAVTIAAVAPLGAALPLARIATAAWPVRAALGQPKRSPEASRWPSLTLVVIQILSSALLLLLTGNAAVLAGWASHGSLLDAPALLPYLSDVRLWAAAALLALSVVEPWRVLALTTAMGLDLPGSEPEIDDDEAGP